MKETPVQQRTALLAAQSGLCLWRNNVGACKDDTGRLVRYGLANESMQMNKEIKSSDLIGITPVQAYLQSAGWVTLGVFTAIESKHSGWKFTPGDERAVAQLKYHDIVRQHGGFAGFVNDPQQIFDIVRFK